MRIFSEGMGDMRHEKPWIESYGTVPHTIDPDRVPSALHLLEHAMSEHGERIALRCFGQSLSYAEVDALSAQLASFLQHELGVKRGDRVAAMMPNIPAFPVATLGLWRAGAAQVNVNPLYTARELEHQLNDAGCEIVFVYSGVAPTLAEILPRTGIRHVIVVDAGSGLHQPVATPAVDARLAPSAIRFDDALQTGVRKARVPLELRGDDLAFLQYTGGTTGRAKGAALTHRNVVAITSQIKAVLADDLRFGEESIVTALPLYHIFALALNFICYFEAGAQNWLVPNPRDFDGFVDVLKAARPTVFPGVNTLFNLLLMHPGFKDVDWSRLRLTVGGGAAILRSTSDKWAAATGQHIRQGYGLSETSGGVSLLHPDPARFTGTCGLPLPSTDVKLLGNDDNEVAAGGSGEIVVKGPQVMRGYWNQPAATAEAFTPDGYFRTGDIGQFDAQGCLTIVDRKKDMVIVSGFNVYPNEVEAVAAACPGVLECACVGMPDDRTGEAVKLFVVRTPGSATTDTDILAKCRLELAGYKIPKLVQFIDGLPKSTVGKILRRELRGRA